MCENGRDVEQYDELNRPRRTHLPRFGGLHQLVTSRTKEHQKDNLITLNGRNHVSESSSLTHAPLLLEVYLHLNRLPCICDQLSLWSPNSNSFTPVSIKGATSKMARLLV
jgi:hypothetical protein